MSFYVYIIQSLKDESFYKGVSENVFQRVEQHNRGESNYTSFKTPWKLVYYEEHKTKKEALIRERNLKKADHNRIIGLINSSKNKMNK